MPAMLLRHFHTVCAHLFDYLAPQDIVVLLSSCRTLRNDTEASAVALQRNPTTHHFYQDCLLDWCKTVPNFDWDYDCCAATAHEENPWNDDALVPASQRVALLSLAGLMASQLQDIIYDTRTGYVYQLNAIPFILPIHIDDGEATTNNLCAALNAIRPQLGDSFFDDKQTVTEAGLHWENLTVHSETGDIKCTFCESMDHAIEQYEDEGSAYWEKREEELEQLQDQWRDAGYDSSSDEFDQRTEAYEQSLQAKDAFYDEDMVDESVSEIAKHLLENDRLPLLKLMAPKTQKLESCVEAAVAEGYTEDVCPHVYRPLRRFFDTHGFQHVRRVKTSKYKGSWDLPRSEIGGVEIVGGLTPHGFFAGVYLVEVYI